jgi:uncharacterized protein YjiS (DUF1127 family)
MEAEMQTLSQTTRSSPSLGALALSVLNRLADLDGRYRARCRLVGLSDDALKDVGLTRADLERVGTHAHTVADHAPARPLETRL